MSAASMTSRQAGDMQRQDGTPPGREARPSKCSLRFRSFQFSNSRAKRQESAAATTPISRTLADNPEDRFALPCHGMWRESSGQGVSIRRTAPNLGKMSAATTLRFGRRKHESGMSSRPGRLATAVHPFAPGRRLMANPLARSYSSSMSRRRGVPLTSRFDVLHPARREFPFSWRPGNRLNPACVPLLTTRS